ncbi:aldose 1-epimerase [Mesorhizobium sp. YR577]|uniref:aldose 1-epimerase n=1 Tax=Mesorhizobium sp. YR577 TaxID=1884373 RepID=UPI0008EBF744|nr:aldose 1-epimerase [Mesorhizobium sp. YR577]SFU16452.1 aldose 1-epimerase [Mesorhizobium sp. YR577]
MTKVDRLLHLAHGPFACTLDPQMGGALHNLTYAGRHFLRSAWRPVSAAETACFAMLPFCNRVSGEVRMNDKAWPIAPNFGTPPAPCHGDGWQSVWKIDEYSIHSAQLSLASRHPPFAYNASQTLNLSDEGLRMELSIRNEAEEVMPFGLGFHPYFPDPDMATLKFTAHRIWLEGPDRLPTEPVSVPPELDHASGGPISPHWRNNSYDDWAGLVQIDWSDGRRLSMQADAILSFLHVYRPPGQRFFCLEPQTHVSGAMGWAHGAMHGIAQLAPGATLQAAITLSPSLP